MPASSAAWTVAIDSARSAVPYMADMPMRPRPMAETRGPVAPSWRVIMAGNLTYGLTYVHCCQPDIAYEVIFLAALGSYCLFSRSVSSSIAERGCGPSRRHREPEGWGWEDHERGEPGGELRRGGAADAAGRW